MITIQIGIKHDINGDITFGAEIPTTEAKAEELIKQFMITWFPLYKHDSGWLVRDNRTYRSFTLDEITKIIWFKKKMH